MECTVRWTGEGMTFLAETGSKHVVAMDGAPDGGGRDLAPRPMEIVLAGTGGCTAYDIVVILKKSGQDVRGCEVVLTSERARSDPKVFTKIHMHFRVRGRSSLAGSRARCPLRCSSTCRSVSARKARFQRSPSAPASAPMANEPAYQSGLRRLRRPPSSRIRSALQARWSSSSRAACV